MRYRERMVDAELTALLRATGAVLVEGPRGCGKTVTARQASRSEVLLDVDDEARATATVAPNLILPGRRPRLIDEWQLVPAIWNHVRRAVDASPDQPGQFILTGSAVPADDHTRHTGAMRFSRLRMRPMSLFETGHSTGDISLAALLEGAPVSATEPGLTIEMLAERIAVGGWPGQLRRPVADALSTLRSYVDEVCRADIARLDGIRRDPEGVSRVLRSLARHVATQASARSIAADVGGADGPMDHHTVLDYVSALTRLMVVEDLPAWAPALRSRSSLRSAVTRHFVDPSLAVAALDTRPERLLQDVKTLGFLFESLVIRDLRVYAQANDSRVFHFRDATGLEADAIVEARDGRWMAFEVKLGQAAVDGAAANLLRLAQRIDPTVNGAPAALVIVTGWGYGYRRPDGVIVVPIGALRP